jgi:hypothetical protein
MVLSDSMAVLFTKLAYIGELSVDFEMQKVTDSMTLCSSRIIFEVLHMFYEFQKYEFL